MVSIPSFILQKDLDQLLAAKALLAERARTRTTATIRVLEMLDYRADLDELGVCVALSKVELATLNRHNIQRNVSVILRGCVNNSRRLIGCTSEKLCWAGPFWKEIEIGTFASLDTNTLPTYR